MDVDDKGVQEAAKFGAAEVDSRSNSLFKSRLMTVLKADSQVVAGMNYRLVVRLGELDCRRNEDKDPSSCQVNRVQKCTMTVWSQPWLSSMKLTDFHCKAMTDNDVNDVQKMPEFGVGGHKPVDVSGLQVKQAVDFVIKYLNSESDDLYTLELFQVVNGTQQVVAGLMLHLKLELVVSSCEKSDNGVVGKVAECTSSLRKNLIECDVQVVDQVWQDPRHVLHQHRCRPTGRTPNVLKTGDSKLTGGDHAVDMVEEFESFKQKYQKAYSSAEEEQKRFQIFKNNMKIARQIQLYDLGTATYGASPFADLTVEEFSQTHMTPRWDSSYDDRLKPAKIPTDTPADSFDWRKHGAVTPVKNQGYCGSCWAFSVTGNIEGQWAIKKKKLISLSEQELVDCDKLDDGCNGGFPSNAYHEIQRLGGLETESEYPYKGMDEKCTFVKQEARVYINGSLNISKNEDDMKAWLYKHGPMSIGINAFAMQFYLWGISHPWKMFCAPNYLDHGVAIVGYGIKHGIFSTKPYWIVKNSWGKHWGEHGYYLVYRGAGVCGLNTMVSSAVVD